MRDVARPIIFALAVAALNAALHYARLYRVELWLYRAVALVGQQIKE